MESHPKERGLAHDSVQTVARLLVVCGAISLITPAHADNASPVGRWRTYDPDTNELRSIIEITSAGGELQGRVIKRFPPPGDPTHGVCGSCRGAQKDQPLLGMVVLWGEKRDGDGWSGGHVLVPRTGTTYDAELHLEDAGKKLAVRAYVGSPLLGKTVTWQRDQ